MGTLDQIRESTRADVEKALAELRARRDNLATQLREVERDIGLAEAWLDDDQIEELLKALADQAPSTSEKAMPLHDAMALVLHDHGNAGMTPTELAREINARGLYRMKDGRPVAPRQVGARARNYEREYGTFIREGGRIRLRDD